MKCSVCGKEVKEFMYSGNICSDKCFTKNFWEEALDDSAVIINGKCYHIGDEDSTSYFRGFGGRPIVIIFNDGRKVRTTNLWHNGTIPKEYYKGDNARWGTESDLD